MSSGPDYSESAQIQADATKEAARIQAESQKQALELQEKLFGQQQDYLKEQDVYNQGITKQNQANYQPYINAGQQGLSQMTSAMNDPNSWLNKSFNADNLQNDAGYQFRLDQGQTSLNKSLAAGAGLLSGDALKATAQFSQGLASDEYNNAYSRFTNDKNNRYTQLSNLTGLGLAGANGFAGGSAQTNSGTQLSNVAGQYGSNVGNIITSGAENQANLVLSNAQQQAQWAAKGQQGGSNWIGGALGGAATGAKIGSAIPGIGTAFGAAGGAILGGLGSLL